MKKKLVIEIDLFPNEPYIRAMVEHLVTWLRICNISCRVKP